MLLWLEMKNGIFYNIATSVVKKMRLRMQNLCSIIQWVQQHMILSNQAYTCIALLVTIEKIVIILQQLLVW